MRNRMGEAYDEDVRERRWKRMTRTRSTTTRSRTRTMMMEMGSRDG
jgi:hypothetical protein